MNEYRDIESADVKNIDSDGKPDFTEGITYEEALERAKGAYDSLEELREARKELSFWDKAKLTWKGETQAGRIAGTVLDVAEIFLPGWAVKARHTLQGKQTTETMAQSQKEREENPIRDILSRVFTSANGGFIRLWDELKGRDWRYYVAFILRIAVVLGIGVAADYLGIPVNEFISILLGL